MSYLITIPSHNIREKNQSLPIDLLVVVILYTPFVLALGNHWGKWYTILKGMCYIF